MSWIDLLMQVHDAFVCQTDNANVDRAVETIIPLFNKPILINGDYLTIPVDVKVGKNWGSMKDYEIAA